MANEPTDMVRSRLVVPELYARPVEHRPDRVPCLMSDDLRRCCRLIEQMTVPVLRAGMQCACLSAACLARRSIASYAGLDYVLREDDVDIIVAPHGEADDLLIVSVTCHLHRCVRKWSRYFRDGYKPTSTNLAPTLCSHRRWRSRPSNFSANAPRSIASVESNQTYAAWNHSTCSDVFTTLWTVCSTSARNSVRLGRAGSRMDGPLPLPPNFTQPSATPSEPR